MIDWKITIGFCAIEIALALIILYIMVTSEFGKGAGSKTRAIILLACTVAVFAVMLIFLLIVYLKDAEFSFPVIVGLTIFVLVSGRYLIGLVFRDVKKYLVKPSVTV